MPALVEQTSVQSNLSDKAHVEQKEEQNQKLLQLSQQLKGEIGENLINTIDFNHLQSIVLDIISSFIIKSEINFDERKIIENSLQLWIACVLHNNEIINEFYKYCEKFEKEQNQDFLIRGLTIPKQRKIREEFFITFDIFASKAKSAPVSPFEFVGKKIL